MPNEDTDLLRRLYQAFDVRALRDVDAELRVELDEFRKPQTGVAHEMYSKVVYSSHSRPCHQVLAGHNGSGKSTELWYLKSRLEAGGQTKPFFTVYCDADDHVDRNDVDFLDVLVAMLRQLATDLRERLGIELKPGYIRNRLGQLWGLLKSDVQLEALDLPMALGKLSVAIKGSPDARAELRKAFEPDAGNWMQAANECFGEAIRQLDPERFAGLVMIVDDLDKMANVEHQQGGCLQTENLFVRRAAQLTGFECHVIYSMPLDLAYSEHKPVVANSFGGDVPVLPMTKLYSRPPGREPHEAGVDAFSQVIDRRLARAGARRQDLFADDGVMRDVILLSGGQPTELMTLAREAMLVGLPIATAALPRLLSRGRLQYMSWLREDHWEIIKQVSKEGRYKLAEENKPAVRALLRTRAILQYLNRDEWYDVNPYLRDVAPEA
jgi:hypothetical protein